ncbi:MAG: hypothetical protein ISR96_06900 [Nitrospira sp.]|nr:hypothetical protein [bacterium]MBL7049222.1 hypothetical protein [Nitrospira sp.]
MKKQFLVMAMLFSAVAMLTTACGGGGGGGGAATPAAAVNSGIVYSGVTSQAQINATNANSISASALNGGAIGGALASATGVVQDISSSDPGRARQIIIYEAVMSALDNIDNSGPTIAMSGLVTTKNGSLGGDCGSASTFSVQADDVTGEFSGTFTFNDFCDGDTSLSGSININGRINPDETGTVNMQFTDLSARSGGDSFTSSGTMQINIAAASATLKVNALFQDNNSGLVAKCSDLIMTITEGTGFVDIVMSGTFYHPVHGFVVLSTESPLRVFDNDEWPSQGVLVLSGSGATSARLKAVSATTFSVAADTNGDSIRDYDSGTQMWAEL